MRRRRRARGPNRLLHRLARDTSPSPNARIVRRSEIDRSGEVRNRSSSGGRTVSATGTAAGSNATPRTIATGTRDALPIASPLAAATSSASATTVASSSRPWWSVVAAEVDERRDARAADRDVHDAATPGPAERVRDHDGDLDAEPFAQLAAEPLRRAVRVLRQQREEPLLDVGGVDARVRAHEPVAGLGDHEVAAPGDEAPRLALDPGLAAAVGLGDHAALGLGHDLLRHRDHVAVANAHRAERSGEERRRGRRPAGPPGALDGQHLDAHAVRDAPITRAGRARTGRAPPPSRRRS